LPKRKQHNNHNKTNFAGGKLLNLLNLTFLPTEIYLIRKFLLD